MNVKNLIIIFTAVISIVGVIFFIAQIENQEQSEGYPIVDEGTGIDYVSEEKPMPNLPDDENFLNPDEHIEKSPETIEKSINVSEWQTYTNENYNIELKFPDWWTVEIQEEVPEDVKNLQSIIWLSDKKDPYEGITIMIFKDSKENTLNENRKRKDIIPFFAKEYYLSINNIPSIGFRGNDMHSEEYKKVYILGGENFSYIILTNSEDIRIFEEVLHSFNLRK